MAKRTNEPEITSYAVVQIPGGYALRTLLSQGERVIATDDSEVDTLTSQLTALVRHATRDHR